MQTWCADHIRRALRLQNFDGEAARAIMAPRPRAVARPAGSPGAARQGAVLAMLFTKNGSLHVALIRRQDTLAFHPGQVSLPGGRREGCESLLHTALRETAEEIGITAQQVTVLGRLHPIYIPPSDFIVHPFVAWHPGEPRYHPDDREVAGIIEADLAALHNPGCRSVEVRRTGDTPVTAPCFLVAAERIWGATAMILSELIERLRASAY
jgi:8-oxo-dGTP pyrophosphatase MutT (NUDIX family)